MLQDIHYAIRRLRQAPLFTAIALLSLAIGFGVNTAMFSVINAVLLRPMPYPNPQQLVTLNSENTERGLTLSIFSAPEIADYRAKHAIFSSLGAYRTGSNFLTDNGSERIAVNQIDAEFFNTLQQRPLLGRSFSSEDMPAGAPPVAILHYGFWQRRFGGDPQVLGRIIHVGDTPVTVVGVMPQGSEHPGDVKTDVWMPLVISPQQYASRGIRFINAIARLDEGVTIDRAQRQMTALSSGLAERFPEDHKGWTVKLTGLRESVVGEHQLPLMILFGAVIAVLLIASINVASLMSSRGVARRSEIAIRSAIGASRSRLVRQVLIESAVLSVLGGIGGVVLARFCLQAFLALVPPGLPRIDTISIDSHVLLFGFALVVSTTLLFGWLPAGDAARTDPNRWLGTGRSNPERNGATARAVLIVVEVAATLVLVTGAVLLLNSFQRLQTVDTGLKSGNVVTFSVSGPPSSQVRKAAFLQAVLQRIQAQPDVQAAALSGVVPMRGFKMISPVHIDGAASFSSNDADMAAFNFVTTDYFRVFGMPVIKGRSFGDADRAGMPLTAVVNESLARRLFQNDAVGHRIQMPGKNTDTFAEIVGVVSDVHQRSPKDPVRLEVYTPAEPNIEQAGFFSLRTHGDPTAVMTDIPGLVRALDNKVVIEQMATVPQLLAKSVAEERFRTILVSVYSLLAVLLSVIGVYSAVAHSIGRRQREIGIRMALGGQNRTILGMLLRQSFTPCLVGITLGLLGSIAVARAMQSLLFGISPSDPVMFISSVAIVALTGLCACTVPALRALLADPLIALRDG